MNEIEYLKQQLAIIINLYKSEKYEELILKSKILIKKFPEQIIFHNAASLSLSALGKNEEAKKILKKALGVSPNDINVLNNLGLIYFNTNENEIARTYFEKALSINEKFVDVLINLGNLNLKENKIQLAKANYEKALEINSSNEKNESIFVGLAQFFHQTGDFQNALIYYKKAKDINPKNFLADREISTIYKYKNKDDPHIKEMENRLKIENDKKVLMNLSFALAKAYEDLREYKKSFNFLKYANDAADKTIDYNINNDVELFSKIKNIYNKIKNKPSLKSEKKIIFILGMPRSGTTLAEQIISSHADVYGCGELTFLSEGINKYLFNDEKKIEENFDHYLENSLHAIQKHYLDKIKIFDYNKKFITDKAPLNFRWIGIIKNIFPNSKIIHCSRNKMDTCFSNYKNFFSSSLLGFTYNLQKLGKYYTLYEDLMLFWKEHFGKNIFDLDYENIIINQKDQTRKLLDFCELDWDENCLSPQKNKKIISTASIAQARLPVYKSSINKWKNYSEELIELKKIIGVS
jgi:tetratricopeptide (TPR) repeat protein